jgi:hypothetical protein
MPLEPEGGTVRIIDDNGSPASKGAGRLEIFKK